MQWEEQIGTDCGMVSNSKKVSSFRMSRFLISSSSYYFERHLPYIIIISMAIINGDHLNCSVEDDPLKYYYSDRCGSSRSSALEASLTLLRSHDNQTAIEVKHQTDDQYYTLLVRLLLDGGCP